MVPDDPRSIGGYRTLARIGAGGMGVVYLARTPGGTLAAVKVIRAQSAADPGYRARFRREAQAASRVTGAWAVPVLDADTEADEPWLATAFVPGPSLAETVQRQGPLPPEAVRTLGCRLSAALAALHEAGLIHRDVKPANVLLALDGPRLIDFGIARHQGATALTATDAVIGTPGYLAPEQASAGPLGPSCDVFSLGCVLVHAATGRRPFGDGTAAAVLFRTVHEEPDLTGLPAQLLPLVTACLSKDPAERPAAEHVTRQLTSDDNRWDLPGLRAAVAERSAAVLALPDPDPPTTVDTTGTSGTAGTSGTSGTPGTSGLSRRRLLTAGAVGGVLVAGGAAAWLSRRDTAGTATQRPVPTYTIGLHADLTGPGRTVGRAHQRGVRLAVDRHNSRKNKLFALALRTEDDGGDATRALSVADRLATADGLLAVIGPTGDVVPGAVVDRYEKADLAQVVVAAGSTTADRSATESLCVIRPSDSSLPTALIHYLAHVRRSARVVIVEDRATPDAAWAITNAIKDVPIEGTEVTVHTVPADTDTFAPVARAAVNDRAASVVYAGASPSRGARCARALRSAGFTGTGLATGPALAPGFLRDAEEAADGWVFAEPYADPAELPAARAFTTEHHRRFGTAPATWAAEAYDAVGLIAAAAGSTSASDDVRAGIAQRMLESDYQGITRRLSFYKTHQVRYETGLYLYRIDEGAPRFLGPYGSVS
nr:bifunctional serine/threonine-protein kinase/ABC transporter substrate-binding protein [Streptomyces sp. SID5785]